MNPNKNRQRGKKTEKQIAKRLGGKRIGLLGKEDISHPVYSIEVKSRVTFAGKKFLEQAERNCEKGKTPIAIVHSRDTQCPQSSTCQRFDACPEANKDKVHYLKRGGKIMILPLYVRDTNNEKEGVKIMTLTLCKDTR